MRDLAGPMAGIQTFFSWLGKRELLALTALRC
jgi:hypothetical protein